jgi:hypothetical protein
VLDGFPAVLASKRTPLSSNIESAVVRKYAPIQLFLIARFADTAPIEDDYPPNPRCPEPAASSQKDLFYLLPIAAHSQYFNFCVRIGADKDAAEKISAEYFPTGVCKTIAIANTVINTILNDPQFMGAYRKLAERAIKSSADEDQRLVTMGRLAVRRHPDATELATIKGYRASEVALMQESPDEVKRLLAIGFSPVDPSVDPVEALAALTVVTASVMNTSGAYTLR